MAGVQETKEGGEAAERLKESLVVGGGGWCGSNGSCGVPNVGGGGGDTLVIFVVGELVLFIMECVWESG